MIVNTFSKCKACGERLCINRQEDGQYFPASQGAIINFMAQHLHECFDGEQLSPDNQPFETAIEEESAS